MLVVGKQYNTLKFEFSEIEADYFRRVCAFDDDEELAFNMKMKHKSNQQIATAMNASLSTANRRIKSMKKRVIKALK